MTQFIIDITVAAFLFIVSVFCFFRAVVRRSLRIFIVSVFLFIGAGALGLYGAFVLLKRTVHRLPVSRSGIEIYSALFGKPSEDCVSVINQTDQDVPLLDCCIWLEFRTCPGELARIAGQEDYEFNRCAVSDTLGYETVIGSEPAWWKPDGLGDSIFVLKDLKPHRPNHARFLLYSKDSTHAFYCDMAN